MALRLPGGVRGRDLRGPIPPDRDSSEGYTDERGKRGAIKTQAGYFLDEDPGCIDTSFFSMGRKEVERCDPRHRQRQDRCASSRRPDPDPRRQWRDPPG
ncbi:Acyl transferase/acyl hydrolase/lysophospholipase [Pyricularia oryzae]|nr:Acyl transferase/acyl hydrolase/lysophospholipase [Pyricularia oryzae]KAI7929345.1 Acyl transferase/acyl hydrolase/lysophospholipase [Pyricularia oryzae]